MYIYKLKNIIKYIKNKFAIIIFSIFASLSLYQQPLYGQLIAIILILLLITTIIIGKNIDKGRNLIENKLLLLFLFEASAVTFYYSTFTQDFVKLISQMILFVLLGKLKMNKEDEKIIENSVIVSTLIFSIIIIQKSILISKMGYIHGRIPLFGTTLDPNYICITLVPTLVLLINNIYDNYYRNVSIILYFIILIAVICTSSRGGFLGLLCSHLGLLCYLTINNLKKLKKKVVFFGVLIILFVILFYYISFYYSLQWSRMISINNESSDNGRFEIWKISINLWQQYFVFGCGFQGVYQRYYFASHNTFIQILSETGITGGIIFFSYLLLIIKKAYICNRIIFIMLITVLIQACFLDALNHRFLWIMLCWIAILPMQSCIYNKISEKNRVKI